MKPLKAADAPTGAKKSNYPEPFFSRMAGRTKRKLGDVFGLSNFGVNLTTLEPGAGSALLHRHSKQDEFIYILEGDAVLDTGDAEHEMRAGDCFGFPAAGTAHRLLNRSDAPVVYLEVGDRTAGDAVDYPADDLEANLVDGAWVFTRKDGTPY